MAKWMPIRKVIAAAVSTPLVVAFIAGQDGVGWREALVAVVPVIVAYLTPEKSAG